MISARISRIIAAVATVALCGCALPSTYDAGPVATTISVPLAVTNDSPELVRVVFVSDAGQRFQIGTVAPHSSARLSARFNPYLSGYLYAHRTSNDAATPMQGAFETYRLADRSVVVRIGASPAFDYWHIGH